MYIYKYIFKNLDSLLTPSLLTVRSESRFNSQSNYLCMMTRNELDSSLWVNLYHVFFSVLIVQNKQSECENWQTCTGKRRSILEWIEKGSCDLQNTAKGRLVTYLNMIDWDLSEREDMEYKSMDFGEQNSTIWSKTLR